MKKYAIWIILGLLILFGVGGYNGLVSSRENVNKAWSVVESQYQRRLDLIPNLDAIVSNAAEYEGSTIIAVTKARQQITNIKIDPNNMTPEKLQEYQAAQTQLGSALNRLLVVSENYPQLRAVEGFRDFQQQIEGTENRIAVERRNYSIAVQEYNTSRAKFPKVIIANLFGFKERPTYEAEKGAEKAPVIQKKTPVTN